MQTLFAGRARLPDRWAHDVRVSLRDGRIDDVAPGSTRQPQDIAVDTLLPSVANLHSHSFQRAMAGMTEHRAAGQDSFWTWRSLMYRFIAQMSPDQVQAIAALTFMEMQEAGYAAVGEFHYVHHQPGGHAYDDLTELSGRVYAAAAQTGIGLTHLPVLYTYGGAGKSALSSGQRRFGNGVEGFARLVEQARAHARRDLPDDTQVGIAPHSLRATCPADLAAVLPLAENGPVHIHVAEQPREVCEVLGWLGARPVEWLLDHAPVDDRWCLIHATHMTDAETQALARSAAVAGLCPITEANLGDGPFNGAQFLGHGGAFGIGSDSNVRIALPEELRMLEYSQRLRDLARNVMVPGEGAVGDCLYLGAARGGAQALNRDAGRIAPGALADLVAINSQVPALCALGDDQLLDGLCFAAGDGTVTDLWSAGRHQVRAGRHIHRDNIVAAYRKSVGELLALI